MKYLAALLLTTLIPNLTLAVEPMLKNNDRIVFFGDSITKSGAKPGGYIQLVKQELQQARPNSGIKLIGAGIGGNKVSDLLKRLEKNVLKEKPNLVMIYVGINDVWHWTHPNAEKKGLKGTTPEAYEAGLIKLVTKIKATGAKVLLCTPSVIGEKHDGTNPDDKMLDQFAEIGRKVAKETNSKTLDLRKAFIDYLKENNPENLDKGILTRDTVHLNETGNKFLATLVLEAFAIKKEK